MDTKHARHHVREHWAPILLDRNHKRWDAQGATTLQQRANRKVRDILESHRAEPLPGSVVEAVEAVARA